MAAASRGLPRAAGAGGARQPDGGGWVLCDTIKSCAPRCASPQMLIVDKASLGRLLADVRGEVGFESEPQRQG